MSVAVEIDAVIEEIRSAQKFFLTTHENPDGDALGSLLGMHELLKQLGKESVMFLAAEEFPLPWEYRKMPLDEVKNEPPADLDGRTVVFLDCGNIDRMPVDFLQRDGVHIVNVDHHHDNTRFGTVNLVDPQASCTAEIVWELAKELGAEITPAIGDPLYVGLVTDTGKFMYTNTSPRSHRMAAELIEAGVDAHAIYRRLYEQLPYARLELLSRALKQRAALRRRRRDRDVPDPRRLRGDGLGRERRRRGRRPPACGGRHQGRGARARAPVRRPHRHAQGQPALDRGHGGRLPSSRAASAAAGTGRRPARRPSCSLDELMATIRKGIQEQL